VEAMKEKVDAISDIEDLQGKIQYIETLKAQVKELYQAVTSVELIGTATGRVNGAKRLNNNYRVDFYHGKMATNEWFGNDEAKYEENSVNKLIKADDSIRYTVGQDIRTNNILLVRVNPVTATFNASQVKLMDSQKRDLSEIVTIGDPYRYTGLITRAQTSVETGLWCIPVSVKAGVQKRIFNRQVYDGGELNAKGDVEDGRQIAYAVSITNTENDQARYVASTYDLATRYVDYEPANYFNPTINDDYTVRGLHNRWGQLIDDNNNTAKDGVSGEDSRNKKFDRPEMAWASPGTPYAKPTAANTVIAGKFPWATGADYDAMRPFYDYRFVNAPLDVEVGKPFTISNVSNSAAVYELSRSGKAYNFKCWMPVEYYYVTLDLNNAIESNPSERNAWNSYSIKGLNTMTPGDDPLDMVIESETATGDWIGFRIYAVNYDGTLVDPDGIAFYVRVAGEEPQKTVTTVPFTATYANAVTADHDFTKFEENSGTLPIDGSVFTSLALGSTLQSATRTIDGDFFYGTGPTYAPVKVHYELLDASGAAARNWKDIASIRVAVDRPEYLLDGQTSTEFTIEGRDNNTQGNPILNELTIVLKKNMPTTAPASAAIKWLTTLGPDDNGGIITVYPRPYGWLAYDWDWATNAWANNYDPDHTDNNPNYWATAVTPAVADWNPGPHTSYNIGWYAGNTAYAPYTTGQAYNGLYPMGDPVFRLATNFNTHTAIGGALNPYNADNVLDRSIYRIEIANANDFSGDGNKLYIPTKSGVNAKDLVNERVVSTLAGIQAVTGVETYPEDYDMFVPAKYIDNGTHDTKVYYYYKDISLTLNNDGGTDRFVKANYEVPMAATFKTRINDMMTLYTYKTSGYTYVLKGDGTTAHPDKTIAVGSEPYIIKYKTEPKVQALYSTSGTWAWNTTANTYGTPTYTTAHTNLVSLIAGTNHSRSSELLDFYYGTNAINPENYSTARLYDLKVSISATIATYYTLSGSTFTTIGSNASTNLVLEQKPGLTPTGDFNGTINITGKDIFGKTISVDIPVKVVKNL